MPNVSVVMPVFNGESYLDQAIQSVLKQRDVLLELIIVNDGSTDRSLSIIQSYEKTDDRVRLICRPNSGRPACPKNDGIAVARGEYLCFLDQDDLYEADRTWQLVDGLECNPDWVAAFSDMRLIDSADGTLTESYLCRAKFLERAASYLMPRGDDWYECSKEFFRFQSLVAGSLHTSSVVIARHRLLSEVVKFDTQFMVADDVDLWIRLGMCGKIGYLNRTLSKYRIHATNTSRNQVIMAEDTELLHRHNFERVKARLTPLQLRQLRSRIANCIRSVAYLREQKLMLPEARARYIESFTWAPTFEAAFGFFKTLIPVELLRLARAVLHRRHQVSDQSDGCSDK